LLAGAISSANVTAAEFALLDGGSAIETTAVADGHGLFMNQAGTMRHTTVQTLAAYLDDKITAMPNLITTAATTVGALASGSIATGFGVIQTGNAITTTGLGTFGSLDVDDVVIDGTTIGHTDDTDLLTLADGIVTVAGEISVTTLDIGGTNVTSTAAELNLLDGGATVGSSITLADNDGIVVNDSGITKLIPASDLATYVGSGAGATTNNALNASLNTKSSGDDANVVAGQVVCIDGSGKITGASALQSLSKLEVIGVATAAIDENTSIGSNIHSAWGKVVNVKIESATVVAAGDAVFLENVSDAGLKTATPSANVVKTPPSAAGTDVYRLGYAIEAAGNGVSDVDIIWMPQFIVAN
jgi:hypothetical protein